MHSTRSIPAAAWQRRLDEVLAEPGRPYRPPLRGILELIPVIARLGRDRFRLARAGREPIMDAFAPLDPGPVMGVPLGGLGGGTITRGWHGDFLRWQLRPGMVHVGSVPADQFSLFVRRPGGQAQAQVLYPGHPQDGTLGDWRWDMSPDRATYHALYPRAWTVYEEPVPGLRLTCRQVSPVIPHNYRESSTPAAVFVWTVENTGVDEADVSLMFTFQNGTGVENDRAGGHHNSAFAFDAPGGPVKGVSLHHVHRQSAPRRERGRAEVFEDPLTVALAVQAGDGAALSYDARFDPAGSGAGVWRDFAGRGVLPDLDDERPAAIGEVIGAAVCAAITVPPGEQREVVFALAWDMPLARFGNGRAWYRRYTRFYGRGGDAAPRIALDALRQYPEWETLIDDWQAPVLADERLPGWYKQALFNEAYFIADGGTIWTDGEATPAAQTGDLPAVGAAAQEPPDIGHFAYLEGHEYRMYNTYDVHFYASFALAQLWPELELSLQRDFARALLAEHTEERRLLLAGGTAPRKAPGIIPHDLGGPTEDPWYRVNIYHYQDVNRWKDLNPKFVLQVYRDFVATQDVDFLAEMWPAVETALEAMRAFDRDGDGLIENDGFPDQTYDTWTASGVSAYSGGLWLAAVGAAAEIAALLDRPAEARRYHHDFARAARAYQDKLWNGAYYDYDASDSPQHGSIMADQLAGDWYTRACGLPGIVPSDCARRALLTVFEFNVQRFQGGQMGAVNGMRPDGTPETSSMQAQEVWPGVTYAVAAAMLQLGLDAQAWATARGAARQTYEALGYWFQTPEAWTAGGGHRSLGYMRPLAIWAMQWAWERRRPSEPE